MTTLKYRYGRRAQGAGLAALMLAGWAVGGCHRSGGGDAGGAGNGAGGPKATPVAAETIATQVGVTPAKIGSISETGIVTGQLNALHDVVVGVKAAGKLAEVLVREGDRVSVGTVIARQDTTDLEQQRNQQEANLLSARTRKAQAQASLESARAALANAQTNVRLTDEQTRSAVRQAQAGLEVAKEQAAVVRQGARLQERQQAEETVRSAKADRDKARSDLKRYQDLYRQQAIAAQQLDQAQAVSDAADARFNSANQALSLIREGSRPEDIRRAEAAVEQARQALIAAQSNRNQLSLRRADVTNAQASIQNAIAGVQAGDAGIAQAQATLRLSEQAIKDATVRSPINGVVAERKAEPGQQIAITKPDVARIVALDSIYFDAQLPESQYADVRAGQRVAVSVDAIPNRTFAGTVTKIFPVASAARSFTARVSLSNEGSTLRPGMFARGVITLGTHSNTVLIPRQAILDITSNSGRVLVANSGKVEERKVRLGITTPGQAEVLSGLRAGDKVITTGQGQVQPGDKVTISGAESASAAGTGS